MTTVSKNTSFRFVLLLALASAFGSLNAQETKTPAAPPAKKVEKPDPSLAPITDNPALPRVLLIGDSISMGYTIPVRTLLDGKANVHRVPTNGGPTINGLAHLKEWLGTGKWDVIHFNWGLHDLRLDKEDKHQVEPAQYEANLRTLVKELKATGAKLIWCSTTPVPDAKVSPMRKNEDVLAYNAIAQKVMKENGIPTDDLYSYALPELANIQRPANVHYTGPGYEFLAKQVVAKIEAALPKK